MHIRPTTLRFYERRAAAQRAPLPKSGIRRYGPEDLEWIALIVCLKNTGMSIRQIRDFVDLSVRGDTLKERCEMLREHKRYVQLQIRQMHLHLETVSRKIAHFSKQYESYRSSPAAGMAKSRASQPRPAGTCGQLPPAADPMGARPALPRGFLPLPLSAPPSRAGGGFVCVAGWKMLTIGDKKTIASNGSSGGDKTWAAAPYGRAF